jgi:microcompartment protein CcmK/EutM
MQTIYKLAIAVSDSDKKATIKVAVLAVAIADSENPEEAARAAIAAYGGKLSKNGALVCAQDSPVLRQARSRLVKRLNAAWSGKVVLAYRPAQGGAGQWVLLSGEDAARASAVKKQAAQAVAAKKEAIAVATASQSIAATSTTNTAILLQLAELFDKAASIGIPQQKIASLLASKYPQQPAKKMEKVA